MNNEYMRNTRTYRRAYRRKTPERGTPGYYICIGDIWILIFLTVFLQNNHKKAEIVVQKPFCLCSVTRFDVYRGPQNIFSMVASTFAKETTTFLDIEKIYLCRESSRMEGSHVI